MGNYAALGGILMNIKAYVDEYSQQKKFRGLPDKPGTVCDLLKSKKKYAQVQYYW